MRKGEKTKEYIIMKAAELFNQQGYFGSSISDLMKVTGLRKGGIYNHFKDKDELALEAFDYAIKVMSEHYSDAVRGHKSVIDQLIAIVSIYRNIMEDPPILGGCPLLNTAVESDDTHPALRERAEKAMNQFHRFLQMIIRKGIRKGEIQSTTDPYSLAIFITSAMEGGVMTSKLYGDSTYMHKVIDHLQIYLESIRV
jgi:TetR/AcrR family transcriptional repressor of nem operon